MYFFHSSLCIFVEVLEGAGLKEEFWEGKKWWAL
jgi:hypothetical protein